MPKQSLERKKAKRHFFSFFKISEVHLIDKGKVTEQLFLA